MYDDWMLMGVQPPPSSVLPTVVVDKLFVKKMMPCQPY